LHEPDRKRPQKTRSGRDPASSLQADGRQPFLPAGVSSTPAHELLSHGSPHEAENDRFPPARFLARFHPATGHDANIPILRQENASRRCLMVNERCRRAISPFGASNFGVRTRCCPSRSALYGRRGRESCRRCNGCSAPRAGCSLGKLRRRRSCPLRTSLQCAQAPSSPLTGILAQASRSRPASRGPSVLARSKGLSPHRQPRRASIFPGCNGFLTNWITARGSLRHPR
jgi:hypothetical protein